MLGVLSDYKILIKIGEWAFRKCTTTSKQISIQLKL